MVAVVAAIRAQLVLAVIPEAVSEVMVLHSAVTPVVVLLFQAQVAVAVADMRSKGFVFAPAMVAPSTSLLPEGAEGAEVGVTYQAERESETPETQVVLEAILLYPLLAERRTL